MTSARKLIVQIAVGALAAALLALIPLAPASAQNLLESFFNDLGRALQGHERAPEPAPAIAPTPASAFAEPLHNFGRAAPPSAPIETGPAKAFCVRTCDGHYFPVRAHAGMSVAEACHAFCPASETRIYTGGSIDYAVARDGRRYRELANAYAYRKHLVAGCTCNGRDAFGLAHIDAASDPTLRPGDVVATRQGLVVFAGRADGAANFTPVQSYSHFSKGLREQLSLLRVTPPGRQWPSTAPVTLLPSASALHLHSAQR
jgi:hypothetical protein